MNLPTPTPVLEQLAESERRLIYDSSSSGLIDFFVNPLSQKIEIIELVIFPVVANQIQVLRNFTAITPNWDLGTRQPITDHGLVLDAGDTLQLRVANATQVQALMIWRPKLYCPEV